MLFNGDFWTKSLSREKRAEKKGREGQEKERKQRKDRANTTAPASWSSTPIPGENERACRKHANTPTDPAGPAH